MSRQLLYMAAPLRPTEEEIAAACDRLTAPGRERPAGLVVHASRLCTKDNLDRAMRWLAWLRRSFPETTFIAPWIAAVLSGEDDADPAQREAGLRDAEAVIERCDGIVLVGPRISDGMRREMEHGQRRGSLDWPSVERGIAAVTEFAVYDLTGYSADPPGVFEPDDDGAHQEFIANATQRTRDDAERLWRLGRA